MENNELENLIKKQILFIKEIEIPKLKSEITDIINNLKNHKIIQLYDSFNTNLIELYNNNNIHLMLYNIIGCDNFDKSLLILKVKQIITDNKINFNSNNIVEDLELNIISFFDNLFIQEIIFKDKEYPDILSEGLYYWELKAQINDDILYSKELKSYFIKRKLSLKLLSKKLKLFKLYNKIDDNYNTTVIEKIKKDIYTLKNKLEVELEKESKKKKIEEQKKLKGQQEEELRKEKEEKLRKIAEEKEEKLRKIAEEKLLKEELIKEKKKQKELEIIRKKKELLEKQNEIKLQKELNDNNKEPKNAQILNFFKVSDKTTTKPNTFDSIPDSFLYKVCLGGNPKFLNNNLNDIIAFENSIDLQRINSKIKKENKKEKENIVVKNKHVIIRFEDYLNDSVLYTGYVVKPDIKIYPQYPFAKYNNIINYDLNSDEEFEDMNAESIEVTANEEEDEELSNEGDDFVVPDGYLSSCEKESLNESNSNISIADCKTINLHQKKPFVIDFRSSSTAETNNNLQQNYSITSTKKYIKIEDDDANLLELPLKIVHETQVFDFLNNDNSLEIFKIINCSVIKKECLNSLYNYFNSVYNTGVFKSVIKEKLDDSIISKVVIHPKIFVKYIKPELLDNKTEIYSQYINNTISLKDTLINDTDINSTLQTDRIELLVLNSFINNEFSVNKIHQLCLNISNIIKKNKLDNLIKIISKFYYITDRNAFLEYLPNYDKLLFESITDSFKFSIEEYNIIIEKLLKPSKKIKEENIKKIILNNN